MASDRNQRLRPVNASDAVPLAGMTRAHRRLVIFGGAVGLGLLAFVSPFVVPFPIPGWIIGGSVVGPFEHWWYGLSDANRSEALYNVGTGLGSIVYPLLVALVFWAWCKPLNESGSYYPRKTLILGGVFAALSAVYYATSWSLGLRYQGLGTLLTYVAASAGVLSGLVIAWLRFRRANSWWASFTIHVMLFVWLQILCFPWIGELL